MKVRRYEGASHNIIEYIVGGGTRLNSLQHLGKHLQHLTYVLEDEYIVILYIAKLDCVVARTRSVRTENATLVIAFQHCMV